MSRVSDHPTVSGYCLVIRVPCSWSIRLSSPSTTWGEDEGNVASTLASILNPITNHTSTYGRSQLPQPFAKPLPIALCPLHGARGHLHVLPAEPSTMAFLNHETPILSKPYLINRRRQNYLITCFHQASDEMRKTLMPIKLRVAVERSPRGWLDYDQSSQQRPWLPPCPPSMGHNCHCIVLFLAQLIVDHVLTFAWLTSSFLLPECPPELRGATTIRFPLYCTLLSMLTPLIIVHLSYQGLLRELLRGVALRASPLPSKQRQLAKRWEGKWVPFAFH